MRRARKACCTRCVSRAGASQDSSCACALLSASNASASGENAVTSAARIGSDVSSIIAATIGKRACKENARAPSGKDNTRALKIRACGARDIERAGPAIGSVHADGLELVAPGVRDRGFARIGQHDRRAVGGVKREQLHSRCKIRRLREKPRDVLGADLLHVSDMAFAKMSQRLR